MMCAILSTSLLERRIAFNAGKKTLGTELLNCWFSLQPRSFRCLNFCLLAQERNPRKKPIPYL